MTRFTIDEFLALLRDAAAAAELDTRPTALPGADRSGQLGRLFPAGATGISAFKIVLPVRIARSGSTSRVRLRGQRRWEGTGIVPFSVELHGEGLTAARICLDGRLLREDEP